MEISALVQKAKAIRLAVLESAVAGGKGHLGGTYSCVDLLVALYYGGILQFDPKNPVAEFRDRFILSKGHACLALYAIFKDQGILSSERYNSYGKDGGLGGQLDMEIPGVDFITGSLGHSIGVAAGMAFAAKMSKQDFYAYTLVGDAELFEGSMWEAMMFASEHHLQNLVVIIDRNRLSVTSSLEEDSVFSNFKGKVEGFGWDLIEFNGHNVEEVLDAFKKVKTAQRPSMMIANTVKGKGVSFMENGLKWHSGLPKPEEIERARKELTS